MPGDMDWMKVNPFQGKRKIDGQWDEADYEIARQVANGSSSYEKQDSSSKLKAPHHNRLFLVTTPHGASTALCQNEYANIDPTTRSAPAEFTLKECNMDLPRNKREERQSWHAQPVLVCVDRWMVYDNDHYLWWSRVQQWKTIGTEGGISVPATMNLTEYCQCTSKLITYNPISNFKQGKGKTTCNRSVNTGTGFNIFMR